MKTNDLRANDSLRSLVSGMGDPSRDKLATVFHQNRILDEHSLIASYRNSWIVRKIVDIPALDSLRKGRDWQAEQTDITKIEQEEKRLGLWQKLLECKTKARLWGGAAIVIGSPNDDYSEPFDFEKVKKGGVPYLTVMMKNQLTANEISNDVASEWYGKPSFYSVSGQDSQFVQIHPSRLVIQIGSPHPDPWNAVALSFGWGDSVLQHVYDAVMNTESTASNIASLVFEANVDSIGIPDLMQHLSNEGYENRLLNRLTLASAGKSVSKSLVHDTAETYARNTVSFASLPETMQSFLLMVSGAADIPLTRFLGQTPSGLSSTGEGDMKNYYDRIQSMQELEIGPAMWRLDEALIRSALGARPDEIFYSWTPLEQLNETQMSEIGLKCAQSAEILTRTGLFDVEELRSSVSNQLIENGFYPGLADAMKETGNFEPDLGGDDDAVVTDAEPRTLYMRRDVVNAAEIIKHYRNQGVKGVYKPESMHVTIIYSKESVDWMKFGEPWQSEITIKEGGPRLHEMFGDLNDVLVLQFACSELHWRHKEALRLGASFDFDEYQPHISISLKAGDVDLKTLKPWTGEIVLGPEIYEELDVDPDWRKKVKANDLVAKLISDIDKKNHEIYQSYDTDLYKKSNDLFGPVS